MTLLASVKARCPVTDDAYDTLIKSLIEEILAAAWEYMGINYSLIDENTEYFDAPENVLYLAYVNVSELLLYVDDELEDSDDYTLYPERGIVKKDYGKWYSTAGKAGKRAIKAVYAGGYEEDSIPQALRGKLVKQVAYEFRRRNDPGLMSVTFPDGSVNKFDLDEWLPDVEKELNRRRRLWI